jgi:hypothetical protein
MLNTMVSQGKHYDFGQLILRQYSQLPQKPFKVLENGNFALGVSEKGNATVGVIIDNLEQSLGVLTGLSSLHDPE